MRAYLDESGIHEGAEICAISGYFGDQTAWENLEAKWGDILREFGVPEFHANIFWARRDKGGDRVKPYAGWDDPKADLFLDRLLATIKDCSIYPVGAAVVGKEWGILSSNERRYLTGGEVRKGKIKGGCPSKSYFLPFLQAVQRVARYCGNDEKVDFFFGLNTTFGGYALNYYKDIINRSYDWGLCLSAIAFPRSVCTKPLQPSDLLSYQVYQYVLRRLTDWDYEVESCPTLAAALTRVKSSDDDFKLYDKMSLDAALQPLRKGYPELCRAFEVPSCATNQ
ncbi:MAG TPA: hypothetical protein VKM93_23135 [Terriglobia bacterium]|nr:hypothetical protein [Terriglobia bacterium]